MSAYEKVRRERIQANKARLAELGLHDLARDIASQTREAKAPPNCRPSSGTPTRRSDRLRAIKAKSEEMEISSGESDEEMIVARELDEEEDDYVPAGTEEDASDGTDTEYMSENEREELSKARQLRATNVEDDDYELQKAISLSLEQLEENACTKSVDKSAKEDPKRRKKLSGSALRLSSKEIVALYHAIVGGGRGLSLRELQKMATTHNFTWSKHELQEMISIYDGDQDGTLSLDEFLNMSSRCHILEDHTARHSIVHKNF